MKLRTIGGLFVCSLSASLFALLCCLSFAAGAAAAHAAPVQPPTPDLSYLDADLWEPPAADEKVIYGADDRRDVFEVSDQNLLRASKAVCLITFQQEINDIGGGQMALTLFDYTLGGLPPCSGEAFANQPTAGFCTGFLVADNLIATAGHCTDVTPLSNMRFVFGYVMQDASTPVAVFNADQVYRGVEIVSVDPGFTADPFAVRDHALIRLDRDVTAPGAEPLAIRRAGGVQQGERVGVIGHPSGLPLKIAFGNNTRVTDAGSETIFFANTDTYGGNSGSPVFNASTMTVEGILVNGFPDFTFNASCFESNRISDNTQISEGITKASVFEALVPLGGGSGNAPECIVEGVSDADGDGFHDDIEMEIGTDPCMPESFPISSRTGDVTVDLQVDSVDVQLVINGALGIETPYPTDMTGDGRTRADDVQLVINQALGI